MSNGFEAYFALEEIESPDEIDGDMPCIVAIMGNGKVFVSSTVDAVLFLSDMNGDRIVRLKADPELVSGDFDDFWKERSDKC